MLRLPDGLRDRIKASSDANGRSMNSEIVDVLLRAYPEPTEDLIEIAMSNFIRMSDEEKARFSDLVLGLSKEAREHLGARARKKA